MSLLLLSSEAVGANERGDHVGGDRQGGSAVDQLDNHRSDPPQAGGVEPEDAEGGDPEDDEDQVKHGNARGRSAVSRSRASIGPRAIKSRRGRPVVGVSWP
jgi:hypothetical protein